MRERESGERKREMERVKERAFGIVKVLSMTLNLLASDWLTASSTSCVHVHSVIHWHHSACACY